MAASVLSILLMLVVSSRCEDIPNFNWAGAAVTDTDIKSVTGTFTVPTVKYPSGSHDTSANYAISTWIGIDGVEPCVPDGVAAVLQTGIAAVMVNGKAEYHAWYQWFPSAHSVTYTQVPVAPGDSIRATVVANSKANGTVTIENMTSGKKESQEVLTNDENFHLCSKNAEWIVEPYNIAEKQVAMLDFGEVTFTDASYTTTKPHDISAADTYDIIVGDDPDKLSTNSQITPPDSVKITYKAQA